LSRNFEFDFAGIFHPKIRFFGPKTRFFRPKIRFFCPKIHFFRQKVQNIFAQKFDTFQGLNLGKLTEISKHPQKLSKFVSETFKIQYFLKKRIIFLKYTTRRFLNYQKVDFEITIFAKNEKKIEKNENNLENS